MTLLQRIVRSMGVSVFARASQLTSQLITVPILIYAWGPDGYGQWIVLSAVASYVGYASLGLAPALRSKIANSIQADDISTASKLFFSGLTLILISATALMMIFSIGACTVSISSLLHLRPIANASPNATAITLGAQLGLNLVLGIINSTISACDKYNFPDVLAGSRTLVELVATALLVFCLKANMLQVAILLLSTSFGSLAVAVFILYMTAPPFLLKWRSLQLGALREVVKPMLGALILNFTYNGIVVQLPRLIIASVIGPEAVATYTLSTQLMRIARMAIEVPSTLPTLEIVRAHFAGQEQLAQKLLVSLTRGSFYLALILIPIICGAGPTLVHLWTAGRVNVPPILIGLLTLSTLAYSIGLPSLEMILGINQAYDLALKFVISIVPFWAACYFLTYIMGVEGTGIAIFAMETYFALAIITSAGSAIGIPRRAFVDEFLLKPIDLTKFQQRLRFIMGRR